MRLAGNRKELECAGACTGCWERFVLVEGERGEEEVEVEDVFVFWISFCRSDFLEQSHFEVYPCKDILLLVV